MDKKLISEAVIPVLEQMGCFLVEVTVSSADDIEIVIEKAEGTVDMDDCAAVDRFIHERFSQDYEDYSLTVSSAGPLSFDIPTEDRPSLFISIVASKEFLHAGDELPTP